MTDRRAHWKCGMMHHTPEQMVHQEMKPLSSLAMYARRSYVCWLLQMERRKPERKRPHQRSQLSSQRKCAPPWRAKGLLPKKRHRLVQKRRLSSRVQAQKRLRTTARAWVRR